MLTVKGLDMKDLDTCLDTGAVAVSLRESNFDEIKYRQEKKKKAGLLGSDVLFQVERIKTQHFVGFDYEPGKSEAHSWGRPRSAFEERSTDNDGL